MHDPSCLAAEAARSWPAFDLARGVRIAGQELGDLNHAAVRVYVSLLSHAKGTSDRDIGAGWCFPRRSLIAHETGLDGSTVRRSVRKLESLGLVYVERRAERLGQRSNWYRVLTPAEGWRCDW